MVLAVRTQVATRCLKTKGRNFTFHRAFKAGLEEVVVGRRIVDRIEGLELGGTLKYRRQILRVVGVFEAEGAAFESEVWGDYEVLRSALRRAAGSNSLVIRVKDAGEVARLDRWLRLQQNWTLKALSERQYYEDQAGPVAKTIRLLGGLVAVVMGIGAVFAAMNTMYRVVASRTREIGTLRAIGFSRGAIGVVGILCGVYVLFEPRVILDVFLGGRAAPAAYEALTYSETFRSRQGPWLLGLLLVNIPIFVRAIVRGRESTPIRHTEGVLSLVLSLVMIWTVLDGPVFVTEAADRTAKFFLILIAAATLGGIGFKQRRSVRPAPDQP